VRRSCGVDRELKPGDAVTTPSRPPEHAAENDYQKYQKEYRIAWRSERVCANGRTIEVARVRITETGRQALAKQ